MIKKLTNFRLRVLLTLVFLGLTPILSAEISLKSPSFLRFVHVAPGTPALDFSVADYPLALKVEYGTATQWTEIWVQDLDNFKATESGTGKIIIPFGNVKIRENRSYTLFIYPSAAKGSTALPTFQVVIGEPMGRLKPGHSQLRFMHFLNSGTFLKMRSGDYTLFQGLEYQKISDYIPFWTSFFNDARLYTSAVENTGYDYVGALNYLRLPKDSYFTLVFFEPEDENEKFRWMVLPAYPHPPDDTNNLVPKSERVGQ